MNSPEYKNINNLTSLWKNVGNAFQNYFSNENINHCYVLGSEWPNRIWIDRKINEADFSSIKEIIQNAPIALTTSIWSDFDDDQSSIYERFGFTKKFEQIGMSMKLQQKFDSPNRINLEKVANEKQAKIWSALYPQSFGYTVSTETLIKTYKIIDYFLIYFNGQVLGTVITHKTEKVVGIHGLGIIPSYRKQGFAEEVMALLLNKAIDDEIEIATLQSSAMGKNIYLKMGFSEDFLMSNYTLTNTQ